MSANTAPYDRRSVNRTLVRRFPPAWGDGETRTALRLPLAVFVLVVASSVARAEDGASILAAIEDETISLIERVEPSIVSVVRGNLGADRVAVDQFRGFGNVQGGGFGRPNGFGQSPQPSDADFMPEQFGAGVVVADDAGVRFILTNHHVVEGGPIADASAPGNPVRVYVRFHDGRGYYATLHASDPRSDLAVLRVDYEALGVEPPDSPDSPDDFPKPIVLSNADRYRKGQFVLVLGNPYAIGRDGSASVAWGLVGNLLRRPSPLGPLWDFEAKQEETIHHFGTLLHLDCRADLGFSGGAAVDRNGELIGVTTALAALDGYESTAGFAIPIDSDTRRILGELLKGHEVEYGFLGVKPEDLNPSQLRSLAPKLDAVSAVRAESVKHGSPAERAGLRTGDLILSIGDRPVRQIPDLMRIVGLAGPGAEVEFEVYRLAAGRDDGERLTFRVRLDKWPVVDDEGVVATVARHKPWRGLQVDFATARQRFVTPQFEPYPHGVVILSAEEPLGGDDPLQAGDFIESVNGRDVETPEEFYGAVRSASAVTLRLVDGRQIVVE